MVNYYAEKCLRDVLKTLKNRDECIAKIRELGNLEEEFSEVLKESEHIDILDDCEFESDVNSVSSDESSDESYESEESIDSNDSSFEVTSSYIRKKKRLNDQILREEIESLKNSIWCLGRDIKKKNKNDFSDLAQHIRMILTNAKAEIFDIDGQAKYMRTYKY